MGGGGGLREASFPKVCVVYFDFLFQLTYQNVVSSSFCLRFFHQTYTLSGLLSWQSDMVDNLLKYELYEIETMIGCLSCCCARELYQIYQLCHLRVCNKYKRSITTLLPGELFANVFDKDVLFVIGLEARGAPQTSVGAESMPDRLETPKP